MRAIFALILNLILLAVALVTGAVLFLWIAAAVAGIVVFMLLRQKITGRPSFHIYTTRASPPHDPQVIDAEYRIEEK